MHTSKPLERRAFLVATTATVVTAAAGCEDEAPGKSPQDAGKGSANTTKPDTKTAADAGSTTGAETTTDASSTTGTQSTANASDAGAATSDQGSPDASSSDETPDASLSNESSSGHASTIQTSSSETPSPSSSSSASSASESNTSSLTTSDEGSSNTDSTSTEVTPLEDACFEGGGTDAGMDPDAGAGVLCSTNTDNGDHCHRLVIPESDLVSGEFYGKLYVLEDGGTGHTHTMEITHYEVYSLLPGTQQFYSTADDGHYHVCVVTCTASQADEG